MRGTLVVDYATTRPTRTTLLPVVSTVVTHYSVSSLKRNRIYKPAYKVYITVPYTGRFSLQQTARRTGMTFLQHEDR